MGCSCGQSLKQKRVWHRGGESNIAGGERVELTGEGGGAAGSCGQNLKLTKSPRKGQHFNCPQHYCLACEKSGDGVDMTKCIRCPTAYHTSCMPRSVQRLLPQSKVRGFDPRTSQGRDHFEERACFRPRAVLPACLRREARSVCERAC